MIRKTLVKSALLGLAFTYGNGVQASATCTEYHPDPPDQGIYWFKNNEKKVRATANVSSQYFDPSKPTVIFIHGRQAGLYDKGKYERFDYKNHDCKYGFDDDLVKIWRNDIRNHENRSWNVGAYYWQKAASKSPEKIEGGIWASGGTTKDFVDEYRNVMSGYSGEIRIVGHSMGNQLALSGSRIIVADRTLPNPTRVALLDPFYSNLIMRGWKTSGELAVESAEALIRKDVIIELYRTSLTSAVGQVIGTVTPDDNSLLKLRMMSAHADLKPRYVTDLNPIDNISAKHIAAPYLYFQSMRYSPADEVTIGGWRCRWIFCYWDVFKRNDYGVHALSASTPNKRVGDMMDDSYYWEQVTDENRANTERDQFRKVRRWVF